MKFWKRIFPYLILNVIISAATTLLVLTLWDRSQSPGLPISSSEKTVEESTLVPLPTENPVSSISATLPPLDTAVIEIETVFGPGDIAIEGLELKRLGEGELLLTGWKISNGRGSDYTFPYLVLNKNGSVRLYTREGTNSVIELYWGLSQSVWRSGDTVSLTDQQGNLRATYTIP